MITFIFPHYLWLLLIVPFVYWLALLLPRRLSSPRFWGSLALRTLIVALLVLALAGIQFRQPVNTLDVVFLIDSSDSIALSQRARAEAYVQQALAAMPEGNRAGIVVFGERALVERPPDESRLLGQITTLPGGERTNIQSAVQLGLSLLSAERQRRLVLLSDGGENSGDVREAARLAAAQGVPIEVVTLSSNADGLDAQISGIVLPATAREGQRLRMVITLDSVNGPTPNNPQVARLVVEHNNGQFTVGTADRREVLVDQPVELTGGIQSIEVLLPPPQPAFNRYVARLQIDGDVRLENNAAEAYTFVSGRPQVLLIAGAAATAQNLQTALQAANLEVTLRAPQDAPTTLSDLSAYEAVVLVNVPQQALPQRTNDLLPSYVRDLGRGLAMIGGDQSFGAGGWRDTPVEAALPVQMDLRTEVQQPPVSIVVVIDVSGSMGEIENGSTKVALAAEGAARIAAQLRPFDDITVIPFDDAARQTVGPLDGTQRAEAIERIASIEPGGAGINIYDALQEAARFVRASDKPVRHIFTITDGNDTVQQEGAHELVTELRRENVTLSSIAVGNGGDVPFLQDIVQIGGGRFFLTGRAADVPNILTGEAQVLIQPFVVEGAFTPLRGTSHPILRSVETVPPLYGYIATTPKASAQVLLTSPRGDPILAVWQYGLGYSLAWTPDMSGQWAKDWVSWSQYPAVAAQMLAALFPPATAQRLTLDAQTQGDQLVLTARATRDDGTPETGLRVTGQMLATDGTDTELRLLEVAPGSYRLALSDLRPGAYLVQLLASNAQGQIQSSITGGALVPLSNEYRYQSNNPALLANLAQISGGRVDPEPSELFASPGNTSGIVRELGMPLVWLALILLPFDIALRRLLIGARPRLSASSPARGRETRTQRNAGLSASVLPPAPPPPQTDTPLERMRAAQERARRRARGEE